MKKFALKQWYPSLYDDIEAGTIVDYEDGWIYYTNKRGNKTTAEIDEWELSHKDFWELIEEKYCDCNIPIFTLNSTFCMKCLKDIEEKKPLFVTEDGVEVFNENSTVYCITRGYNKHEENYISMRKIESYLKVFFHESNADGYIWRNKPVFSYEDLRLWDINGGTQEEALKIAKERSKK